MALTCATCGMAFASEQELKDHAKQHMGGAASQQFRCASCGGTFPSEAALKDHAAKVHRM